MPPRKKTKLTVAANSNESIGAGDRDQARTVVRRRILKGSLQSLPEFAVEVQLEVSYLLHVYMREYTRIRLCTGWYPDRQAHHIGVEEPRQLICVHSFAMRESWRGCVAVATWAS